MPTSFPGSRDNLTNPTATDALSSAVVPHASQHTNANDAIEAIEDWALAIGTPGGPAGPLTAEGKLPASQSATFVRTQGGTAAAPTPIELSRLDAPAGDTHGPFNFVIGGAAFGGVFDRAMYFGYNVADGGGRAVGAEPSFRFVIESDYFDGTNRLVEPYLEWAKAANAGRSFADAATTSGSKVLTSATAAFTAIDRGAPITGAGIPANTYIAGITSATSIVLSANATATATGVTVTIAPAAQQRRPLFMQLDRVSGVMRAFELRTSGITFSDWDTNETFSRLTNGGLTLLGVIGQQTDTTLVLSAQNGKKTAIQMSAPVAGGLLVENTTNDVWSLRVGSADVVGFTPGAMRVGDQSSTFIGAVTSVLRAADRDAKYNFYARAVAAQSTQMIVLESATAGTFLLLADAAPAAADETIIRTLINGALKRLVVGAADSAGVGFRAVRVAN